MPALLQPEFFEFARLYDRQLLGVVFDPALKSVSWELVKEQMKSFSEPAGLSLDPNAYVVADDIYKGNLIFSRINGYGGTAGMQ